jgi:hypothetical protein
MKVAVMWPCLLGKCKKKQGACQVKHNQPAKTVTEVIGFTRSNYFLFYFILFYYIIKKYKIWFIINPILQNKIKETSHIKG